MFKDLSTNNGESHGQDIEMEHEMETALCAHIFGAVQSDCI